MPAETMIDKVRDDLRALLAPLQQQLEQIDSRLDEIETERDQLRQARRELVLVVARLNGDTPPGKPGPRPGSPRAIAANRRPRNVGKRKLDAAMRWVEEQGATAGDLTAASVAAATGLRRDTVRKALQQMHEQGRIRLVRTGEHHQRFYRLVGDGAS